MEICTLTGSLRGLDGTPLRFARIEARLAGMPGAVGLVASGSSAFMPGRGRSECITNAQGAFQLLVPRGALVMVMLPQQRVSLELLVPDLATADLFDHLFPRPVSVDWAQVAYDSEGEITWSDLTFAAPGRVELAAGGTQRVALRVEWTTGLFAADDPANLVVEGADTVEREASSLRVTRAAAGDVTIDAQATWGTIVTPDLTHGGIYLHQPEDYAVEIPDALVVRFT